MNCKYCNSTCIKKGFQDGKQKYKCKSCNKNQRDTYTYRICDGKDEYYLILLNNEGMSISSMSRLTGISKANVVNKIRKIGRQISLPIIKEQGQQYEADEMKVLIGKKNKHCPNYLIYALNKDTKQVINMTIGRRTKENVSKVIDTIIELNPKKVYTDKLNIYKALLENEIHVASSHMINHIERFNLTLRTHIRRLSRDTICFSKSAEMLEYSIRIYIWKRFVKQMFPIYYGK